MNLIARNINPFTDFGFKKLFGEEASKDILLDFSNPNYALENLLRLKMASK